MPISPRTKSFRIWLMLIVLAASGCSSSSQETPDTASGPRAEASPPATSADTEAVSTPQPAAEQTPADPAIPEVDIDQLFAGFVVSPDSETFLALRRQIIVSDVYQPYSDEFTTAEELLDLYQLDEAREALRETMPNLLLSPRAHQLLADIHSEGGDVQAAERERTIAAACVEGILTTGDGSEQQPWLVLRTSDEYDVLAHLGKRLESQGLVLQDDQHLDMITCSDGTKLWFDVSDAFARLSGSFAP